MCYSTKAGAVLFGGAAIRITTQAVLYSPHQMQNEAHADLRSCFIIMNTLYILYISIYSLLFLSNAYTHRTLFRNRTNTSVLVKEGTCIKSNVN